MHPELVTRAQMGDPDAFAALATGAWDRLRTTARRLLRDAERADDAAQEALIAAWSHLPSLRDPERFDAWLHRLLLTACHRSVRRDLRRRTRESPLSPADDRADRETGAPLEIRDELERAFRQVSVEHRRLLALVYLADLTIAEAAVRTGIPPGTAKSRLSRALRAVRAALDAEARSPVGTSL